MRRLHEGCCERRFSFAAQHGEASKARNTRLLRARGETVVSLVIRDAAASDIPALARLHVETWNATHSWWNKGPTYELREHQWRDAFGHADGSWFCLVVERSNSELVGFAKGRLYDGDLNGFGGELNKIYLLREYHRLGLGRRLVGYVARRFLRQGHSKAGKVPSRVLSIAR